MGLPNLEKKDQIYQMENLVFRMKCDFTETKNILPKKKWFTEFRPIWGNFTEKMGRSYRIVIFYQKHCFLPTRFYRKGVFLPKNKKFGNVSFTVYISITESVKAHLKEG